jgi:hypothetical protein
LSATIAEEVGEPGEVPAVCFEVFEEQIGPVLVRDLQLEARVLRLQDLRQRGHVCGGVEGVLGDGGGFAGFLGQGVLVPLGPGVFVVGAAGVGPFVGVFAPVLGADAMRGCVVLEEAG